jgi:hypothetical protein
MPGCAGGTSILRKHHVCFPFFLPPTLKNSIRLKIVPFGFKSNRSPGTTIFNGSGSFERMGEVSHFFYFLASDCEPLEQAWKTLTGLYNLRENELCQFGHDPLLSRMAKNESCSLAISIREHIAVLELRLTGAATQEHLAGIQAAREGIKDILLDLVGESTFVTQVGEPDLSFSRKEFTVVDLPRQARLLVTHPAENDEPRLYVLVTREPAQAEWFLLPRLVPLDCLTYQIQRQLGFYEDQHHSLLEQEEELNRKIGAILYRKEVDHKDLEKEVEKTAEIYGLLTNYGYLLSNALRILRSDLAGLEKLAKGTVNPRDGYFYGHHRARLKRFLALLAATQQNFSRSLDHAKAAIDVMKSRVDLVNSGTNLGLQKQLSSLMHQNVTIQEEALVMASAATMVEFFIVLYYGFGVWKTLAGEQIMQHIPVLLKAGLMVGFSLAVVVGTHKAAKAIKEKEPKNILASAFVIVLFIAAMAWVSLLFSP